VRGCFVTGTGTEVGKTVVAAAVAATLRSRGERVAAFKPVVTGLDDPIDADWPADHELLAAAAGMPDPEVVAPLRFGPAVSPHLAAELAGTTIRPAALLAAVRRARAGADVLVVEGVGGPLVPLAAAYTVRDLAVDLGLPVIAAAAPGLGTINHTLLTLEALRHAGLHVVGVVMTPWPPEPARLERSNRETVARMGDVEVAVLPTLARAEPALLAAAGAALPLERWLR
jgi:dethiobiotin synthetase